jgi:hypothetical protein
MARYRRDGFVSAPLEIRVKDPRPRPFQHADHLLFGVICEVGAGSGCLVVRARIPGEQHACYVYLKDVTEEVPAGTVVSTHSPDMCVIGPGEVAVREARPGAATPPE